MTLCTERIRTLDDIHAFLDGNEAADITPHDQFHRGGVAGRAGARRWEGRRVGAESKGPCPRCGGHDRFHVKQGGRAVLASCRRGCPLPDLADLDGDTLGVHGKGRRERFAYLGANGCAAAVSAWIAVRGTEDGPLFRPVNKGGRVIAGGMSLRAIGKRVQVLGARAGLGKVSPHMLRRSFATSLLSAGNDLSVTADLMGHARTDTTRLYDRRGESAKRAAASTISVPYVRPEAQRASDLPPSTLRLRVSGDTRSTTLNWTAHAKHGSGSGTAECALNLPTEGVP